MEYWLGVLTPFIIILAVALLWLLLIGLRKLNNMAGKRFVRHIRFIDMTTDETGLETRDYATPNGHKHDEQARRLAAVLAAAPGFRMLFIGPLFVAVGWNYGIKGNTSSDEGSE